MNIHYSSSSSSTSTSLSSSSAVSTTSSMHRRRKWSREQLLRHLEILGDLSAPLPPDLPPSPPASPRPQFKRKLDATTTSIDNAKRPRNIDRIHSLPPPPPSSKLHRHDRAGSTEDGEVCESEPHPSTLTRYSSSSSIPIRRPKRGRPHNREFDEIHDKYHQFGRMLKYSGDARFWSTYPSSHKEYRPLPNPPPPNSPYHKFGGLIAKLELIDALVCFTYSIWSKDFSRKACFKETWTTIEAFLSWCKHKWGSDDTVGEREKAFVGLIWMIEAFIHGRKLVFSSRNHVDPQLDVLMKECKAKMELAMKESEVENAPSSLTAKTTPQMLPSPASLVTNSANSTPTGRPDGTPNTNGSGSSSTHSSLSASGRASFQPHPPPNPSFQPIPAYMFPQGPNNTYLVPPIDSASYAAAAAVVTPIYPPFLCTLKELSNSITASAWCMSLSQTTLSLPILRAHFPRTYARIVGNESMRVEEEYECDIEDEEGELCWPGQCVTGEGLGWVCMLGKAMIGELGREVGYRGLDGVVPKPKPEEESIGHGSSAQVKVEAQR